MRFIATSAITGSLVIGFIRAEVGFNLRVKIVIMKNMARDRVINLQAI
jgi:hypothetical protein